MNDFSSIIDTTGLMIGGTLYTVIRDGFYYASTVDKYYIYIYLHYHEIALLKSLLHSAEHPDIIAYNIDNINQRFVVKMDGVVLYDDVTESDTHTALVCFMLWDIKDSTEWLVRQDKLSGLLGNDL